MGVPRITSTKAVTRKRRTLIRDIFIRASSAPRMAPKKTVMTDRANVTLTPLMRNTSQYLTRILMMFWKMVVNVMVFYVCFWLDFAAFSLSEKRKSGGKRET